MTTKTNTKKPRPIVVSDSVLILKEKHQTRYFGVKNDGDLFAACLKVVKERAKARWYTTNPTMPKEPEVSLEIVNAMPNCGMKTSSMEFWNRYNRQMSYYQDEVNTATILEEAISTGDGKMAFQLMELRDTYEYEGFEIKKLEDPNG